jgi:4-alpha-glucanotransferase
MRDRVGTRQAGLLVPLFSIPSSDSWGIGDIGDLDPLVAWLEDAGQRVLQLLPLNEMAPGQHSPYSAISAMAIDPIFIHMSGVTEFADLGGEASLDAGDREALAAVRRSPTIEHEAVRRLKHKALRAAFDRFLQNEWCREGKRAIAMKAFSAGQAWWLDDYALFRAIHAREHERPWTEWPEPLQRREATALSDAARELSREVLFHRYLQWLAATQWHQRRGSANHRGVRLFGDLPFMVDGDSADVWTRQTQFQLDASLGAPPDAFSATGQDWGMPVYRWPVVTAGDFEWIRSRARRSAELYDGFRIDHLVGFYRTYGRPRDGGDPFFTPSDEGDQLALGERVLTAFRSAGAEVIAEDLGTVPDFVRESLARLGVPGFRVLRWEREWHTAGQPYRDPANYPAVSVATSGTHDTEPLSVWWDHLSADERRLVATLPTVNRVAGADLVERTGSRACDALVEALFASGSNLVLLPIQDVFGWADRINEPASVDGQNWTFRLPWPVDTLNGVAEARERRDILRRWTETYQR